MYNNDIFVHFAIFLTIIIVEYRYYIVSLYRSKPTCSSNQE